MEWIFFFFFGNDISRLFSAIFCAVADVRNFAAMPFALAFVPAGTDEWNFPSHHSFFGLFFKRSCLQAVAALWKSCDRVLTGLSRPNTKLHLHLKRHYVRVKSIPFGSLFGRKSPRFLTCYHVIATLQLKRCQGSQLALPKQHLLTYLKQLFRHGDFNLCKSSLEEMIDESHYIHLLTCCVYSFKLAVLISRLL